jgi:hypothetical protein
MRWVRSENSDDKPETSSGPSPVALPRRLARRTATNPAACPTSDSTPPTGSGHWPDHGSPVTGSADRSTVNPGRRPLCRTRGCRPHSAAKAAARRLPPYSARSQTITASLALGKLDRGHAAGPGVGAGEQVDGPCTTSCGWVKGRQRWSSGVSMALLVRSSFGVMPWDELHQGWPGSWTGRSGR